MPDPIWQSQCTLACPRQADDLAIHVRQTKLAADIRKDKALQGRSVCVQSAQQEGLQRVQGARNFAEAEAPYLAAMALRPGSGAQKTQSLVD